MATKSKKSDGKSQPRKSNKPKVSRGGKQIKLADGMKRKGAGKPKTTRARKPNPLHDKLISLFKKPGGATMHDTWNAGFEYPVMAAVRIAERRGLKVKVIPRKKGSGELTRYVATSR